MASLVLAEHIKRLGKRLNAVPEFAAYANHFPQSSSPFIYKGAMEFLHKKMGKLQGLSPQAGSDRRQDGGSPYGRVALLRGRYLTPVRAAPRKG